MAILKRTKITLNGDEVKVDVTKLTYKRIMGMIGEAADASFKVTFVKKRSNGFVFPGEHVHVAAGMSITTKKISN